MSQSLETQSTAGAAPAQAAPAQAAPVSYLRIAHAAHYLYGDSRKGHDLEVWTVAAPVRPATNPEGVPADAEFQSGSLDNGVQTWTYTRTAPWAEPTCPRCAGVARA